MAIFHRRAVQTMISDLARTLPPSSLKEMVAHLNRGPAMAAIVAEWELAVLYGFSKVGTTRYEEKWGTRKPDLTYYGELDEPIFVADICVPSDDQRNLRNPVEAVVDRFYQEIAKANLESSWFHVQVESDRKMQYRNGRPVKLQLPKEHELKKHVFGAEFRQFMEDVKACPGTVRVSNLSKPGIAVRFSYDPTLPARQTRAYGHTYFNIDYTLESNTLYQALKDKATQLKQTGLNCEKGIIVCDGDLALFNPSQPPGAYSAKEILQEFLKKRTSISFILAVTFKQGFPSPPFDWMCVTRNGVSALPNGIGPVLNEMIEHVPAPMRNVRNAKLKWSLDSQEGTFEWREFALGRNYMKITIPAQALLKLMAGVTTFAEESSTQSPDVFKEALAKGYVISSTRLLPNPEGDEDLIELELHGPDASVAPYSMS